MEEREWAGGPSPPSCGQLTRCFSAVAELLVTTVAQNHGDRRKSRHVVLLEGEGLILRLIISFSCCLTVVLIHL